MHETLFQDVAWFESSVGVLRYMKTDRLILFHPNDQLSPVIYKVSQQIITRNLYDLRADCRESESSDCDRTDPEGRARNSRTFMWKGCVNSVWTILNMDVLIRAFSGEKVQK